MSYIITGEVFGGSALVIALAVAGNLIGRYLKPAAPTPYQGLETDEVL